jgi:pyruvate formate lyase activating enzyme
MQIGGFQKLSLLDFPGKIACVVFTQGCLFRCAYCHNPDLILLKFEGGIPEDIGRPLKRIAARPTGSSGRVSD